MEFIEPIREETEITDKINEIITAVNRLLATKNTNPNLEVLRDALDEYNMYSNDRKLG